MAKAQTSRKKTFTYADYCTWPDEERWEIIDGVPYDMTPAPSTLHQQLLRGLSLQIASFLEGKTCQMFFAPFDVLLPEPGQEEAKVKNVVQPDIVIICDPVKITEKGCLGAPDLIIEILSPSTSGKDQIKKRRLYEKFGVREFWTVHPTDRVVTTYRLQENGLYGPIEIFDDTGKIAIEWLPGLIIDLSRVFPPQPKVVRESPARYL